MKESFLRLELCKDRVALVRVSAFHAARVPLSVNLSDLLFLHLKEAC